MSRNLIMYSAVGHRRTARRNLKKMSRRGDVQLEALFAWRRRLPKGTVTAYSVAGADWVFRVVEEQGAESPLGDDAATFLLSHVGGFVPVLQFDHGRVVAHAVPPALAALCAFRCGPDRAMV